MIKIILSTIITILILTNTADTGYMNNLLPTHKVLIYREVLAEVTAYTIDDCDKLPNHPGYGIMANGEYVQLGIVAADPAIPFGTKIIIDGMGEYVVKDRGGDVGQNRIDIYMLSRGECFRFGRQMRNIKILEEIE